MSFNNFNDQLNSLNLQFNSLSTSINDNNNTLNNNNINSPITSANPSIIDDSTGRTTPFVPRLPLSRTTSLLDQLNFQPPISPFRNNNNNNNTTNNNSTVSTSANTPTLSNSQLNNVKWNNNNNNNTFVQDLHSALNSPHLHNNNNTLQNPLRPPPINIESQWKYVDSAMNIQGPFPSSSMFHWHLSGYFPPSLQIMRINTSLDPFNINDKFITLSDLCSKVNDFQNPFMKFDSLTSLFLSNQNLQQQQQSIFSTDNTSILPTPLSSIDNSTINNNNTTTNTDLDSDLPLANINSRDYTHDELLNEKFDDGGYYHVVNIRIPTARPNKEILPDSFIIPDPISNDITTTTTNNIINSNDKKQVVEETIKGPIKVKESIPIDNKKSSTTTTTTTDEIDPTAFSEPEINPDALIDSINKAKEDKKLEIERKRKEKADEIARKLVEEQEEQKKKDELKKLKKQQKQKDKLKQQKQKENKSSTSTTTSNNNSKNINKKNSKKLDLKSFGLEDDIIEDTTTSQQQPSPIVSSTKEKAPLAPWAKNVPSPDQIENVNIAEVIKNVNSNENNKKIKFRNNKDFNLATRIQSDILKNNVEKKSTNFTWATNPTPQPINVDIKSQLTSKSDNKSSKPTKTLSNDNTLESLNNASFIEEQKLLWARATKQNSENSGTSDSAWTTVSSSANNSTNSKTSDSSFKNNSKATIQSSANLNPDKLRAVSSNKKNKQQIGSSTINPNLKIKRQTITTSTSSTPAYPGNASISIRQTFLKWCKGQMKLNPNVSASSVLEVLFSLPAGTESKEIIADTIYSNSSIMDGRRFATEFIKRRIECEKQVQDPLSWSEVLALPEGNDDDWEFQVVKKKGKRY